MLKYPRCWADGLFLEKKEKLGCTNRYQNILKDKNSDAWQLREGQSEYGVYSQNDINNGNFWDVQNGYSRS